VFCLTRPSPAAIARFLQASHDLPLSYGPTGILGTTTRPVDDQAVVVGSGTTDFERAKRELRSWTHFALGWVELFPGDASIEAGTDVAVLIRHLGFWSLNGCRVLYHVEDGTRFGFAYGTLTNHAEAGEELFVVEFDPATAAVTYRIRAVSWPYAILAHIGQPIVRHLQARFRRDSAAAMTRAIGPGRVT
jgi:uncharacterized protein (UPF0548 family)